MPLKKPGYWVLEVLDRSGNELHRLDNMTSRELRKRFHAALIGNLRLPQYAWQLVLRIRWDGPTCPAGHPVDEHPAQPTDEQVRDEWTKALQDGFLRGGTQA